MQNVSLDIDELVLVLVICDVTVFHFVHRSAVVDTEVGFQVFLSDLRARHFTCLPVEIPSLDGRGPPSRPPQTHILEIRTIHSMIGH